MAPSVGRSGHQAAGEKLTDLESTMTGLGVKQRWWARRSANWPAPAMAILIMTRPAVGKRVFPFDAVVAAAAVVVQRGSRGPVDVGRLRGWADAGV